ncbi:MAG: diadenylate cyclase CdaA [Candidatus Delongbacteria bacterium]|nr:diadenylate cyclase CdaA [Candidatus Delongbacteria bacterium]MBN2833770.1 diadenylate cyclase CdaA [Candidatus Delongbacteria bacterium]
MVLFKIGFIDFNLADFVDILLFTIIIYKLFNLVRDTRVITMFIGIFTILLIGFFADLLNLTILSWLVKSISTVFWLLIFILFQPEFRRILMYIGQNKLIRKFLKIEVKTVTDEIVHAAYALSEKRFGGLFVLQKNVGLKAVVDTGVPLKSEVTSDLLTTIFYPRSELHDGAVVIANDVLLAARCILPITSREDLEAKYGTRHRAALGLSEESDAVIIVVSEETGNVSVAYNGEILKIESPEQLIKKIERLFGTT